MAITGQLTELNANPRMFAVTAGSNLPQFYEILGTGAEFVYGPSQWKAGLVTLRAGGLIPIAASTPGPASSSRLTTGSSPGPIPRITPPLATGNARC